MKSKWLAVMIVAGAALIQGAAYAETITGKIVSVDANAMRLVINQKMHGTGNKAEKAFLVNPATTFDGFASLSDLKPGEKVKVEEKENAKSRLKEAVSISLESAKVKEHHVSQTKTASKPKTS